MSNRHYRDITLTLLVSCALPTSAAESTRSQPVTAGGEPPTITQSELTASERSRSKVWDLSETEWRRYRSLMEGIRGSVSPDTISPIEVLGIHARNAAERRRYAERWAMIMHEDAEQILAFQRAYDEATKLLFPDQLLIDLARLPANRAEKERLSKSDRVLLFTRPDCAACDAVLSQLLARLDRLAGLDIYLSDVASDDAIREWATARSIQPGWVKTQQITLNFEGGALERLAPVESTLPFLMRRRNDAITPLPRSAL